MTTTRERKPTTMRRNWIIVNLLLAVVIVAALGTGGYYGVKWYKVSSQTGGREEIVAAAIDAVQAILKISPSTIDADLAQGEELTTGQLREEWIAKENKVRESVNGQSATRSSEVLKAAYSKGDTDSATVLLAVDTTTSWDAPVPDPKEDGKKGDGKGDKPKGDADGDGVIDPVIDHFRVKAEMTLVGDKWLMSSLDLQ